MSLKRRKPLKIEEPLNNSTFLLKSLLEKLPVLLVFIFAVRLFHLNRNSLLPQNISETLAALQNNYLSTSTTGELESGKDR